MSVPNGQPACTRFVVLSAPRTGSNFLCSWLNSHPDVLCHHELFNLDGIRYALDHRDGSIDFGSKEERDTDPVGFLRRAWQQPMGARWLGFKLARRHPPEVFADVYGDRDVRKIVLDRRNRLKMFASDLVAAQENRWTHYGMKPEDLDTIRVRIELDDLTAYDDVANAFYSGVREALQRSGVDYLDICYEDLFDAPVQETVLDFLGIPPAEDPMRGATIKRNPADLRDFVDNHDELSERLAGTRFADDLSRPGL